MDDFDVKVMEKGDHFIDCLVREDEGRSWRFTSIYGWLESGQKDRTWELLNHLGKNFSDPWVVRGDFNEIFQSSEKRGGIGYDLINVRAFRNCLDANGFRELDSWGHQFTWNNKRKDGFIEEKLDRFVANSAWWSLFPEANVENLVWDGSDHLPIILRAMGDTEDDRASKREGSTPFCFEARWLHHDEFDTSLSNF